MLIDVTLSHSYNELISGSHRSRTAVRNRIRIIERIEDTMNGTLGVFLSSLPFFLVHYLTYNVILDSCNKYLRNYISQTRKMSSLNEYVSPRSAPMVIMDYEFAVKYAEISGLRARGHYLHKYYISLEFMVLLVCIAFAFGSWCMHGSLQSMQYAVTTFQSQVFVWLHIFVCNES